MQTDNEDMSMDSPITVMEWPEGVQESYHEPCPKCQGPTTIQRRGPHIEWRCPACGHLRFLAQVWTAFVMPIGKYRGQPLVEILRRDRGYVEWGAVNLRRASHRERFTQALHAQKE